MHKLKAWWWWLTLHANAWLSMKVPYPSLFFHKIVRPADSHQSHLWKLVAEHQNERFCTSNLGKKLNSPGKKLTWKGTSMINVTVTEKYECENPIEVYSVKNLIIYSLWNLFNAIGICAILWRLLYLVTELKDKVVNGNTDDCPSPSTLHVYVSKNVFMLRSYVKICHCHTLA